MIRERVARHGSTEEEALTQFEAEALQRLDLILPLDSLGDDLEAEALADRHDRSDEAGVRVALRQERPVHLEDVDR